jgi:hypothetical protein
MPAELNSNIKSPSKGAVNSPTIGDSVFSKRKLIVFIVLLLMIVGILGINFYNKLLKLNQNEQNINNINQITAPEYYEGKVSYIGDQGNNISYSLVDSNGEEIVLLKSTDSKLKIVEGLRVKVYGTLIRGSTNQKDILTVKEILINNGTN